MCIPHRGTGCGRYSAGAEDTTRSLDDQDCAEHELVEHKRLPLKQLA